MLRRTSLKTAEPDSDVLDLRDFPSEPPRRNRRVGDTPLPQQETAAEQPVERRRGGDRRGGMEELRSEALKALIDRVEDRNFGGLRNAVSWKPRIKASRALLLIVALIAGGIAAVLATQANQQVTVIAEPAPPVVEVVAAPQTQILVAREAIAVGQRISATAVGWEDWPEASVRPEYLSIAAAPDALDTIGGSVARIAILPGEPIRTEKLVPAGEGGFLASVLEAGKRAVSVSVSADAASGGFIVPNDRVDVVLTRATEAGTQVTETVLADVRVLAIGTQLGAPAAPAAEEMGDKRG